jgi:CTP:molybdopterin cytidylyltransferase MocA
VTVGAVVVAEDAVAALADAAGRTAVRRIVDAAWAGGALPIVVVAPDPEGRLGAVLGVSPAMLVDPGDLRDVAAFGAGVVAALDAVAETSAVLLWPARMTWVDPETVTSLIEAHGADGTAAVRPGRGGQVGWPVLLPADVALTRLHGVHGALDTALDGLPIVVVELGDPGAILGLDVALDDLPPFAGPPEPLGGPPPEWGAAAAETPDPEAGVGAEPGGGGRGLRRSGDPPDAAAGPGARRARPRG